MQPARWDDRSSSASSSSSAPFQYSIARPPTGYSARSSFTQDLSPVPPVPAATVARQTPAAPNRQTRAAPNRQTSTSGLLVDIDEESSDADDTSSTYARPDWTDTHGGVLRRQYQPERRQTAYEDHPITALPTQGDGRETPLYARSEFESQYGAAGATPNVKASRTTSYEDDYSSEAENDEGNWEENHTAWSKSSYAPRGTMLDAKREEAEPTKTSAPGRNQETAYEGYYDADSRRESSVGSALLGMADLTERQNPFDDRLSAHDRQSALYAPAIQPHRSSADTTHRAARVGALLTPEAHQKLGRMSVAPVRYTLPPDRGQSRSQMVTRSQASTTAESNPYAPSGGLRYQAKNVDPSPVRAGLRGLGEGISLAPLRPDVATSRLKGSTLGKSYLTYRPVVTPIQLLLSAILLTLALQPGGTLGAFAKVQHGGFGGKVGESSGVAVALGLSGWCRLDSDE
jgi:hypothetical protein